MNIVYIRYYTMNQDQLNHVVEFTEQELYLYSRQILLDEWDLDAQERLKNSHVVLVGAGGLGCTSAEILVRAGIGRLTIFDHDQIELSNLQRQLAFQSQHVGQYKATILAQHLTAIHPYSQIIAIHQRFHEETAQNLTSVDLILDGSDRFKTRYFVNQWSKKNNIPLISASAIGLQGQLFMVDGSSACYECLFPANEQDEEQGSCATSGVLASTPIVMASLQAHHALLYLGLKKMPLREKLLLWNGLTMQQRIITFQRDIHCSICNTVSL